MPLVVTVAPEIAERRVAGADVLRRAACGSTPGTPTPRSTQMEAAVGWGVRHVDHLFCAMSDRARLRQTQTYPMRGGVMEATLYFDELTTEVIADGKHLTPRAAAAGVQGQGAGPARARDRLDAGRGHARRRVLVRRRTAAASACGSSTASA